MSRSRPRSLLFLFLASLALAGCQRTYTQPCEAGELPALFEPVRADLPTFVRVCSDARGSTVSVDFEGHTSPHEAWLATVEHFESRGWQRSAQTTEGTNLSVEFVKDGHRLSVTSISAIDENEPIRNLIFSQRVHGSLLLWQ